MNKKTTKIVISLGIVILVIGLILLIVNKTILKKQKIEIIDATMTCAQSLEKFYEDDKYIYYFTCVKSSSMYVKFENGNKMLIVNALEEELVTIDELLDAGLVVYKKEK